jgi:hypothetical protein
VRNLWHYSYQVEGRGHCCDALTSDKQLRPGAEFVYDRNMSRNIRKSRRRNLLGVLHTATSGTIRYGPNHNLYEYGNVCLYPTIPTGITEFSEEGQVPAVTYNNKSAINYIGRWHVQRGNRRHFIRVRKNSLMVRTKSLNFRILPFALLKRGHLRSTYVCLSWSKTPKGRE